MEANLFPGGGSQPFTWISQPFTYKGEDAEILSPGGNLKSSVNMEAKEEANPFPGVEASLLSGSEGRSQSFSLFKGGGNLFPECGSQPFIWRLRHKPIFFLQVEAGLLTGGEGGSQPFIWKRRRKPIFFRKVEASLLPGGEGGIQPFT